MWKFAVIVAASAAVLVGACSSPATSGPALRNVVTIRVERDEYSTGDTVRVQLTNDTTMPVGYNGCSAELQQWTGTSWVTVVQDRSCRDILLALAPDSTAVWQYALPDTLEPARYRFHYPYMELMHREPPDYGSPLGLEERVSTTFVVLVRDRR